MGKASSVGAAAHRSSQGVRAISMVNLRAEVCVGSASQAGAHHRQRNSKWRCP